MSDRLCSTCGNTYPLDPKHYKWLAKEKKFSTSCLVCRTQQRRAKKDRERTKREGNLRKIEEAGVDLLLGTATNGGSNIPHSAEVIERVFQYFGGTAGFSAVVVKQYWDSPPGGTARNRLIETLCRLVTKNVESGGAKKPLTLWTEDELEQELNNRFQEALVSFKGTTIDVQATKPKRLASKADEAPDGVPTGSAASSDADPVPARQPQGNPKRAKRSKARSPQALPPDAAAGGDTQVQGE
jgi:hypothetical protein